LGGFVAVLGDGFGAVGEDLAAFRSHHQAFSHELCLPMNRAKKPNHRASHGTSEAEPAGNARA